MRRGLLHDGLRQAKRNVRDQERVAHRMAAVPGVPVASTTASCDIPCAARLGRRTPVPGGTTAEVSSRNAAAAIRCLGVVPLVMAAAVLGPPAAHSDPNSDYIATIAQHGVLIINNRDVVEGINLGQSVCRHIREGSSPMAERGILNRNGSSFDQAVWIVRAAQTDLCPDTGFDPGTTFGQP